MKLLLHLHRLLAKSTTAEGRRINQAPPSLDFDVEVLLKYLFMDHMSHEHIRLTVGHEPRIHLAQSENGWMTDDIKLAALRKWFEETGGKPCLTGCDGHVSNTGQEAICSETRAANWLLACPPAHCTANGTAQLDLKGGLISRVKQNFRRLMVKQVAASCSQSIPEGQRGRVKIAVVLRLLQIAAAQAHDPQKNIRDNKRVGYVDGENGFLEYRPFEVLNSSFFQTAAAFGGGIAGQHQSHRTARQERAECAVETARKQIHAISGVLDMFEKPPVADDMVDVPRHKSRSRTQYGAVISSEDYEKVLRDEREAKNRAVEEKVAAASNKAREFAKKWAPLIREAKEAFADSKTRASPGHTGLTPLRVGQLKALIVGHTGKGPKAQNNKEGALKAEAAACIGSPVLIVTPPPSPPRAPAPWGTGIDFQDEWEEGLGFDDEVEEDIQLYF